jgi:hypothetical protein
LISFSFALKKLPPALETAISDRNRFIADSILACLHTQNASFQKQKPSKYTITGIPGKIDRHESNGRIGHRIGSVRGYRCIIEYYEPFRVQLVHELHYISPQSFLWEAWICFSDYTDKAVHADILFHGAPQQRGGFAERVDTAAFHCVCPKRHRDVLTGYFP